MNDFPNLSSAMNSPACELGPRCCAAVAIMAITGIALFIIGCVGAAGAFPGSAIGWVSVALAGAVFATNLSLGNFKERKFDLVMAGLTTAILVTVGALGGTGILSATQVGKGIIGTSCAAAPFYGVVNCLATKLSQRLNA